MESPTGATALLRRTEVRWLIAVVILAGCAGVQSGDSGPSQYQTAVQRMMKLSAGALMYVADHDDVFMPRERWMDVLQPYATDAKDYRRR